MSSFENELQRRLEAIRRAGLYRQLRRIDSAQGTSINYAGREILNFSSNDYLGLANEPAVKAAAAAAVERFGAGAGASRLVCGSLQPYHELEECLAAFKGTEAALSFSTGYGAAIGTICALLGKGEVIILDKLIHASVIDAARLSGATIRVFAHNDLNELEAILKIETAQPRSTGNQSLPLIVTESVFSMDGDMARLREIVELKERYGAWLMVDEAHATGLYGKQRRGLAEQFEVNDRIEVQFGTLGKALGASGGYICGSRALIDYLLNRARTFIFSTAPVPAAAAAATAAIRFVQSHEGEKRRQSLWQNVAQFSSEIVSPQPTAFSSAIIPIHIGDETQAVQTASHLLVEGFFIPAIRYPAVARGQARLRITVTAQQTASQITALAKALARVGCQVSGRGGKRAQSPDLAPRPSSLAPRYASVGRA